MFSLERPKPRSSSNQNQKQTNIRLSLDTTMVNACCDKIREEYQIKLKCLKQKAHQSFMQLMQIQRCHEEEVGEIRGQYQNKQKQLMQENQRLSKQNSQLKQQIKNTEGNSKEDGMWFQVKQMSIDNIQSIIYPHSDRSYLDDSAFIQYKQLLSSKKVTDLLIPQKQQGCLLFRSQKKQFQDYQKRSSIITQINRQNTDLSKINQILKKQINDKETQINQLKKQIQKVTRENIFLVEHAKKLSTQKLSLQKKIRILQKQQVNKTISSNMTSSLKLQFINDQIQQKQTQQFKVKKRRSSANLFQKMASVTELDSQQRVPLRMFMKNGVQLRQKDNKIIV